jgi:N-acetylneuraminic acid mutarotase
MMQPIPTARYLHAACVVGDFIYVLGGSDSGNNTLSSVMKFTSASNTWTEVAPMPTARRELSVCVLGSHIYCIGGYNRNAGGSQSVFERFDTASGTWTTMAPLPTARESAASFVLGGKIYVAGGYIRSGPKIDIVEAFDPDTNSWASVGSLPGRLGYAGGCSLSVEITK